MKGDSREQWENDLRQMQKNVTPADQIRSGWALVRQNRLPLFSNASQLVRFLAGAILLGIGAAGVVLAIMAYSQRATIMADTTKIIAAVLGVAALLACGGAWLLIGFFRS